MTVTSDFNVNKTASNSVNGEVVNLGNILWGKAAEYSSSDLSGLTERGKQCLEALKNPHVRACLDAIAIAELGQEAANKGGYGYLFGDMLGKETFDPNTMSSRPLKRRTLGGLTSSATGRYQTMDFVWDEEWERLGLKDMKPQSQEIMAVSRLMYRQVLDEILRGNVANIVNRSEYEQGHWDLNSEWASLEGNPYGQGTSGGKRSTFLANYEKFLQQLSQKSPEDSSGVVSILVTTPLKPTADNFSDLQKRLIKSPLLEPGEYKCKEIEKEGSHLKIVLDDGRFGYIYFGHCEVEENIPEKTQNGRYVNLKVPYFSQLDNHYEPFVTCNVTSVAMCCAFFGEKPSNPNIQMEDEFYLWLQERGMNRTYHDHLVKVFDACGYQDSFKTDATWDEVKEHLRKGNPVIYSGTLTHGGHIIVIRGFNDDKKCWLVNDPYGEWFSSGYNTNLTGEDLEYSYDLLARKSMTGSRETTWAHFPSKR